MRIVVIGPSGSGKTAVGRRLADRLAATFIDADDLHPAANIAQMAAGVPLTDVERGPWLDAVAHAAASEAAAVIACSALARRYRERILAGCPDAVFIELDVPPTVLAERMRARTHFMPVGLLSSQLAAWEPLSADEPGRRVDGTGSVPDVTERIGSVLAVALAAERPEAADRGDQSAGSQEADEPENQV